MCNRYTLHDRGAALEAIASALKQGLEPPDWTFNPRYNLPPGTLVPVVSVSGDGHYVIGPMFWGIPYADPKTGKSRLQSNARAESARGFPAVRESTAKRRCLVPANGYYEWEKIGEQRFPHLYTLTTGAAFAFAGIRTPATATTPDAVAILTTKPNTIAAKIHDRMPVVLSGESMAKWIGSEPLPEADYQALTAPLPDELLAERPVSRFVNDSRHDGPECLAPPEPPKADPQLSLL